MSLVGNLEDLGLGEILQIVSLSRKSGTLALHSRGREGSIVFRQGQVVRAASSTYRHTLGEVLVQKGILSHDTLAGALVRQEERGFRERLGTILISGFGIAAGTIEEIVREQIENVVYSLFAWDMGSFEFELQDTVEVSDAIRLDPLQFMLDQGLNPQFLAMEGSRIVDEMRHRGEFPDTESDETDTARQLSTADIDNLTFDLVETKQPDSAAVPAAHVKNGRPLVLVDDDNTARSLIVPLLESGGYVVTPFEKSEEALFWIDTLYRSGGRPTILADLIMPRMDGSGVFGGTELLGLIHNNYPELPVLAIADAHNGDAVRKVRGMGYAFLMKPRKGDFGNASILGQFAERLLEVLQQVGAGVPQEDWSDEVNIGDELRFEMGEEVATSTLQAPHSTGISLLRTMLEELYNPALGGGVILLVLRFASEFMNRAVVFFVKNDEIAGLGQFGIDDLKGHADSKVRNLKIPRSADSLFSRVIETRLAAKLKPDDSDWNRYLLSHLGGVYPAEVFLGPIVSEGKVVAILYGDNLPDMAPIGDTDALEIFLSQAGMAMEKALLVRRLKGNISEGL